MAVDIIMHPSCDPIAKSKQPIEKMWSRAKLPLTVTWKIIKRGRKISKTSEES